MIGLHTADCWCTLMIGLYVLQTASTKLFTAARDGDIATVRRLLAEGRVDVNMKDEVGVSCPGMQGLMYTILIPE